MQRSRERINREGRPPRPAGGPDGLPMAKSAGEANVRHDLGNPDLLIGGVVAPLDGQEEPDVAGGGKLNVVVGVKVGAVGAEDLAEDLGPRQDLLRGVLVERVKPSPPPLDRCRAVSDDAHVVYCGLIVRRAEQKPWSLRRRVKAGRGEIVIRAEHGPRRRECRTNRRDGQIHPLLVRGLVDRFGHLDEQQMLGVILPRGRRRIGRPGRPIARRSGREAKGRKL